MKSEISKKIVKEIIQSYECIMTYLLSFVRAKVDLVNFTIPNKAKSRSSTILFAYLFCSSSNHLIISTRQ